MAAEEQQRNQKAPVFLIVFKGMTETCLGYGYFLMVLKVFTVSVMPCHKRRGNKF